MPHVFHGVTANYLLAYMVYHNKTKIVKKDRVIFNDDHNRTTKNITFGIFHRTNVRQPSFKMEMRL